MKECLICKGTEFEYRHLAPYMGLIPLTVIKICKNCGIVYDTKYSSGDQSKDVD